ncbi:hypothetical protein [Egicoccus sp. AB-alg6-2]|uniref:hypothetical protein n=1 Tax=Egicoccus sp. AB-alg6-2 TaxID=3242692 RepID=UPI00359DA703
MARTVLTGAVIALLAAGLAVVGGALGITTLWPVLLAVAIGLAGGRTTAGRVVAYVTGAAASFVAMAVTAGVLPALPAATAVVVVVAILVLTAIAAVTGDRVPLWAGLAGYAAFAAFYEPLFAARPTAFLAEAPVALVTVLLATALGAMATMLVDLLTSNVSDDRVVADDLADGKVV